MRDPHEVLGVAKKATPEEVKKAYRRLAMKYHPDRNSAADAKDRFAEIQSAYETITNPKKNAGPQAGGFGEGFGGFSPGRGGFGGADVNDIFSQFFGDAFRNGSQPEQKKRRLHVRLQVPFVAAALAQSVSAGFELPQTCQACQGKGSTKPPQTCPTCQGRGARQSQLGGMVFQHACPTCNGHGQVITEACAACQGDGETTQQIRVNINIPAGAQSGNTIRLSKVDGEQDVYVTLDVMEHQAFERDGDDVLVFVPVRSTLAVLGGRAKAPTMDGGELEFDVPKGAQHGDVVKIAHQGAVRARGGRGNLRVAIRLETPVKLSAEQLALMKQIDESFSPKNTPKSKSWWESVKDWF